MDLSSYTDLRMERGGDCQLVVAQGKNAALVHKDGVLRVDRRAIFGRSLTVVV